MPETMVDELTSQRLRKNVEGMDDVTLVFTLYGLLAEMEDAPSWGRTPTARVIARWAFTEIAQRWIPLDVFGAAFRQIIGEEGAVDA